MQIIMNGDTVDLDKERLSIVELLQLKNIESPEMVSVQLNGIVVEPDLYQQTAVADGDEVEFLYFMGGGSR